ncbi:kinase-like protein [Dacryopinax primogenitus]|uniref:non-specific serine/threonine protein kinase n=1 Tax=Dacryopinax primogenitus (strain DJM 731) TaxID=1858805 RepID=M5G5Y9_DACPD|nr:kinase-like protein [Dacryopinax primogenitus]EJT99172.1 kinase-like protein [Dacryopinax primogenitus]
MASADTDTPPTATNALITLVNSPWRPILQSDGQIVLYNPLSHAVTISQLRDIDYDEVDLPELCPVCRQPIPDKHAHSQEETPRRASNYFHLLAMTNENYSRPGSPSPSGSRLFGDETLAEGYYETFFREERRLGMGANGTVFLCQHVLDGNPLGHFAVKKIAVGRSHSYLLQTLREVRLLETLRHPNIITYHHAWVESYQFSSFGERVPTLFVLMQFADAGSLDTLLAARQGITNDSPATANTTISESHSAKIRALKARRQREIQKGKTPVHFLSPEEIEKLFEDVVEGLNFLHERSILHLDLKPANVLLSEDPDSSTPRALLSDFGNSQDGLHSKKERSGETGTLEFMAPELIKPPFLPATKAADLWSLGMILYSMIFFRSPYSQTRDVENLEAEVLEYRGFVATPEEEEACAIRSIPSYMLRLLEGLLHRDPAMRPSTEKILSAIQATRTSKPVHPRRMSNDLRARRSPPLLRSPRRLVAPRTENYSSDEMLSNGGSETPRLEEVANEEEPPPIINKRRRVRIRTPKVTRTQVRKATQAIKVAALVVKIVTFPMLCPWIRFDSWRGVFMVGLAAADILSDSLLPTSILMAAHVGLVTIWRLRNPFLS